MKLRILIFLSLGLAACSETPLEAPKGTPVAQAVPDDWSLYRQQRKKEIEQYIADNKVAYDRFADFPVSQTHGVPYILLKLLPIVAPGLWPDNDNFLSVIGLFKDERNPQYPLARGIGFSGLSRPLNKEVVDVASFTCGGCHIGRVREDDGKFQYLDGGINSEFNTVGFRKRMVETLDSLTKGIKDEAEKEKRLTDIFLQAVQQIEKSRPGYFYNNYQFEERHFDAAYEKQQIALFKAQANKLVPAYSKRIRDVYRGWKVLVDKNYKTAEKEMMAGFGGMEDAISFNSVDAYLNLEKKPIISLFSGLALADYAAVTDIMAVWDQQKRNPRWNENKDDLIDGGGQWNGHIPLPVYKNIAAQLTLGVDNIDVQVSAFSDIVLDKLPAPAYPFDVDVDLANKGKALFEKNCLACHQNNNGKVYKNIGTHSGRAKIAGKIITTGAVSGFTDVCSPDHTIEMFGKPAKPCGTYKGESLKGNERFAMTKPSRHDGYNALPLVGIWAQAPYLHNGSVPTIYHLLMPKTRPEAFIKSKLSYDKEKLGFKWQLDDKAVEEGYLYNTTISPSIGHQGHDKNIEMNGTTYRLDWSSDETSVKAIIEYMKVL